MRGLRLEFRGASALLGLLFLTGNACKGGQETTTTLTQAQWEEVKANITTQAPADLPFPVGANYGDKVELIGLSVDPPSPRPGQEMTVTYWWRALAEMDVNWQVFVHFDVTGAQPARQGLDHHPVRDLYQTTRWQPGQIIKDVQKVTLRPNYPGGQATFWIGLWNPADGQRLPLKNGDKVPNDNDNRVKATTIRVDGPAPAKNAPATPPPTLVAAPLQGTITLDGKLDEPAWAQAAPTPHFGGTRGGPGQPGGDNTARVLYDDQHLYIALQGADRDVWGDLTERDSDTWTQEVFEVFIDPEGDQRDYLELQVTPRGTVFDARFPVKLGRGEGSVEAQIQAARAWNSGLEVGVFVDGTLNKRDDEDRGWSVELKLPLQDVPGTPPRPGTTWKLNLYRFDAPRDAEGKPTGQVAWSWTPSHGSFHNIERFGTLRFGGDAPATPASATPSAPAPASAPASATTPAPQDNEVEADRPE